MNILHLIAYFAGGFILTNGIPHFIHGVSGHPFQSPFANPPAKGLSPARTNVLWGFANILAGAALIGRIGNFDGGNDLHVLAVALGVLICAILLARLFAPLHGGEG